MNTFVRFFEQCAARFNTLPIWRSECAVWGQRFASASFERWLYLQMHRLGRMGRAERAIIERIVQPSMTVLDVGGNLGLYTALISRLVGPAGRVISFEPDPDLFELLQRNCSQNQCANVEAHNLALGSRRDRLMLRKMILNSGDNTLGKHGSSFFRREIAIDVVALDEFLPDLRPDLVKIDVQGWELEVLRGMERLLDRNPCTSVYFEYWPEGCRRAGSSGQELIAFLRDHGFTLRKSDTRAPISDEELRLLEASLGRLGHIDILATKS